MRTRTPPSLKWLINKKARLAGEIQYLETAAPFRVERSQQLLDYAERRYLELKKAHQRNLKLTEEDLPRLKRQHEAIKAALGMHEIQINPNLIRPIRPQKKRILPYGTLTRALYSYLKSVGGVATTREIARYIVEKHFDKNEQVNFVALTKRVSHRLKNLALEGKIIRLHNHFHGTNYEGVWKLPS